MGEPVSITYAAAVKLGRNRVIDKCKEHFESKFGKKAVDEFNLISAGKNSKIIQIEFYRDLTISLEHDYVSGEGLKSKNSPKPKGSFLSEYLACTISNNFDFSPKDLEHLRVMNKLEKKVSIILRKKLKLTSDPAKRVKIILSNVPDKKTVTYWNNSVHYSLDLVSEELKIIDHENPDPAHNDDIELVREDQGPDPFQNPDPFVEWEK